MEGIKNKILVMSGKGGVGKTTIAVNLAYSLKEKGFKVGLLDVDIHGPNVPKMLNLDNEQLLTKNNKIIPAKAGNDGCLKVMSMAFLLKKEDAVIWRGPMKHNVIRQFIEDVEWGRLDYLVIDFPPGTGDEAISISQLLNNITGSIIIASPQEVALIDVVKSIDFSRRLNIPIIGIVENMAGEIFGKGSVKIFADSHNVNFLGSLELDRNIAKSGDKGKPFTSDSCLAATKSFDGILENALETLKNRKILSKEDKNALDRQG